jgi:anti-sigma regulatory factor (Ser/Thr protein kinase)
MNLISNPNLEKEPALSVQSGNSVVSKNFRFVIEDASQTGVPRRQAAALAAELDFSEAEKGRVGIVINELCTNLINHAKGGEILLRTLPYGPAPGIEILAVDRGGGIADVSQAMQDGFSTTSTPGTGLGAIQRQSDVFDIYTQEGKGTVVLSIVRSGVVGNLHPAPAMQFGAVNIPIKGETDCGDGWGFIAHTGKLSVMVADGLGHGILAHQASTLALEIFQAQYDHPLEQLMQFMHSAMRNTRGAAISIAEINPDQNVLNFLGIGNVRGAVFDNGKLKNLISYSGTVGMQLRSGKVFSVPWTKTSLLIMHSDGITTRCDLENYSGLSVRHPAVIAGVLYRDFNRDSDDVTILVGGMA